MAAKNDITGDKIKSKTGNQKAYAAGWDRIFNKKKKSIEGSSNGRTTDFESVYVGSTPTPSTNS